VQVALKNGGEEICKAKNIVIATGSIPYRPDDINFDDAHVCDSDTILDIDFVPRSLQMRSVITSEKLALPSETTKPMAPSKPMVNQLY